MDTEFIIKPCVLKNGHQICAEVCSDKINIMIIADGSLVDQVDISYPMEGLGGGEFIPFPSEKLILLSIYSGQSEEGYELFNMDGGLRHILGSGYIYGEAASYGFSSDEREIIMGLPFLCSEWWLPWDDEDIEKDSANDCYFDFGTLRIHNIENDQVTDHTLRIYPPKDWVPARKDYEPFLSPRFKSPKRVTFNMPWGLEEIEFPLPDIIIFHPPDDSELVDEEGQ